MKTAVVLAALLLPAAVFAAEKSKSGASSPRDITGNYRAAGLGGGDQFDIDIAQGDGALAAEFRGTFGISTHTCDCQMIGTPAGPGKWTLSGDAKGSIGVFGEKLILDIERPIDSGCCGPDFPGAPDFKLADAKKPASCTVTAKATYHPDTSATEKPLAKGSKIEAFVTGEEDHEDLVVVRTTAKKRAAGFISAGFLECPKQAPKPAPTAAATPEGAGAPTTP